MQGKITLNCNLQKLCPITFPEGRQGLKNSHYYDTHISFEIGTEKFDWTLPEITSTKQLVFSPISLPIQKSFQKVSKWDINFALFNSDTVSISNRLIQFLLYILTNEVDETLDCTHFARYVTNNLETDWKHFEQVVIYDQNPDKYLKPGDLIAIANAKQLTHFAVYLGNNLFLSRYGTGGPVLITSLDHMLEFYQSDLVVLFRKT